MGFRYVVLGSGRQGTAAAYDLILHGQAERVLLADADEHAAKAAVERLKKLLASVIKSRGVKLLTAKLQADKKADLIKVMKGSEAVLSALPYYLNPGAAAAAIEAKTHFADLGGYLESSRAILKLDAKARKAGVTLVPDCGLAPGMNNTLAVAAMERLSISREVKLYCGGLPQKPQPPLGYKTVFNLEGLLASYFGEAFALRKGELTKLAPFSELEELDFGEPMGRLEAFINAGGSGTCPWTFKGRIQTYEYKTLRYPGHYEKICMLRDLGLLDEKPLQVNGVSVAPRQVFLAAVGPKLKFPDDKDLVVLRVAVRGQKEGKNVEIAYDLVDYHDNKTGFTAMERTTGFAAAVVLEMLANGAIRARGAVPAEKAVPGRLFLEEIRKRGIRVTETIRTLDSATAASN